MLYQDPETLDPIRLLRYSPSQAALMGMSLFTVGLENAIPDEWPEDPRQVAQSEEDEEDEVGDSDQDEVGVDEGDCGEAGKMSETSDEALL